jgi:hypothetical protein
MLVFDGDYAVEWQVDMVPVPKGYPPAQKFVLARRWWHDPQLFKSRWIYGIDLYGGKTPAGFPEWTSGRFRVWDEYAEIPESGHWLPNAPIEPGSFLIYHKVGSRNFLSLAITRWAKAAYKINFGKKEPVLMLWLYDCFFERSVRNFSQIDEKLILKHVRLVMPTVEAL